MPSTLLSMNVASVRSTTIREPPSNAAVRAASISLPQSTLAMGEENDGVTPLLIKRRPCHATWRIEPNSDVDCRLPGCGSAPER
jgi:hypothetical protein